MRFVEVCRAVNCPHFKGKYTRGTSTLDSPLYHFCALDKQGIPNRTSMGQWQTASLPDFCPFRFEQEMLEQSVKIMAKEGLLV